MSYYLPVSVVHGLPQPAIVLPNGFYGSPTPQIAIVNSAPLKIVPISSPNVFVISPQPDYVYCVKCSTRFNKTNPECGNYCSLECQLGSGLVPKPGTVLPTTQMSHPGQFSSYNYAPTVSLCTPQGCMALEIKRHFS